MTSFQCLPSTILSVSSPFDRDRIHPITRIKTPHNGVDLRPAITNEPIKTVMDGTVRNNYWSDMGGWIVGVDHGGGVVTLCAHMKSQSVLKIGSKVKAKDTIGVMGTTGASTGIHLHFELRINGTPVDPIEYLRAANQIKEENVKEKEEEMKIYESIDELTGDWKLAVEWAVKRQVILGNGKTLGMEEPFLKSIVCMYRNEIARIGGVYAPEQK